MTYTFQRSFVGADNKGFLKGSEAPADWPQEKIENLVTSGILLGVETPAEFVESIEESEELAKLDPERKPRVKKG